MIDTAAVGCQVSPKYADFPTLEKLGEGEHGLRFNFSHEASNLGYVSLPTKLLEQDAQTSDCKSLLLGSMDQLSQLPTHMATYPQQPTSFSVTQQKEHITQQKISEEEKSINSKVLPASTQWKELRMEDALVHLSLNLPSVEDFISVVQTCKEEEVLDHARSLHVHICSHGLEDYRLLGNYLVAMFVDCGSMCAAKQAFERLLYQKEHSWTALMQGYNECSASQCTFDLYKRMKVDGVHPSKYTFLALLKACTQLRCLERGREIHLEIRNVFGEDLFVDNALLDMYAKCGSLLEARQILETMPVQDVVSWNTLITGYAENELSKDALRCLEEMQLKGVPPNSVSYLCSLKACGNIQALDRGLKVNMEIAKMGLERDLKYGNSLVDMYGKCGSLTEAQKVFDELIHRDVVSWTALISGYAENSFGEKALECLDRMELDGISSNAVTYVCTLKACAGIRVADKGQRLHAEIFKQGLERAPCVGNTLLDMYAKCGLLSEAYSVFEEVSARDVVSWSALIAGYAEHGCHEEALNYFEQMQLEGVTPNEFSWNAVILGVSELDKSDKALVLYLQMQERGTLPNSMTFAGVLKALGSSGSLKDGHKIHAQVYRMGREASEVVLATSLIDMYGKCGGTAEAKAMFDAIPKRDLVAWSTVIMGYVRQGEIQSVFSMYEQMREEGILPDEMTFLSILTMCSHAGLVDKGWKYFESLSKTSVTSLTLKHLNCMVDLLGRAGRLEEANSIFHGMPFDPDLATCCTMLRACRIWGSIEVGRQAFECARRLDRMYQTAYVLMFNIYADAHMWEEAKEIEKMFSTLQARELQGKSWVEIDGLLHAFMNDEACFCRNIDIYERVKSLLDQCSVAVEFAIDNTSLDGTLCEHSERLAVVFGLLNMSKTSPVRVVKNVRLCDDCHTFLAFLSKMERRTIICRDSCRLHTFKDGVCSCRV